MKNVILLLLFTTYFTTPNYAQVEMDEACNNVEFSLEMSAFDGYVLSWFVPFETGGTNLVVTCGGDGQFLGNLSSFGSFGSLPLGCCNNSNHITIRYDYYSNGQILQCTQTFDVVPCYAEPCLGEDTDGDGICDEDDCDPNNPNINFSVGDICDDGNPNTTYDYINEHCECIGVIGDPCLMVSEPCDDNNPLTINDVYDINCMCVGVIPDPCTDVDTDGDDICDEDDCDPLDGTIDYSVGMPCDDGDPNTENDMIGLNCECQGTPIIDYCHPNIESYTTYVTACSGKKHVYIKLYNQPAFGTLDCEPSITKFQVYPLNDPTNVKTLTGDFETVFMDMEEDVNDEILFVARGLNDDNEVQNKLKFKVEEKSEANVVVSDHFDHLLDEFYTTDDDIVTFFCGKDVAFIEILSFFEEFLDLTPDQVCQYLIFYEEVTGTPITEENFILHLIVEAICQQFLETLTQDDDNCICKLVHTKSSAKNFGTASNSISEGDECENYEPRLKGENKESADDDDDRILSQGRFGAAKAATMHLFFDGMDDGKLREGLKQGQSKLRFRQVCVDPITLDTDLSDCESCNKKLEIEYGYYSSYELWANTYSCFLCTQKAEASIEEWAMIVSAKGDETSVLDQYGMTYQALCDFDPDDPTISDVITEASQVAGSIISVLSNPSVQTITQAAESVVSLIENAIIEDLCGEQNADEIALFSGSRVFDLDPGEQIQVALASGATFSGEIVNHGESFARINSDFYLSGLLTTVANEDGSIPGHCECERIGSYVVGSLEPFAPTTDFPVFRDDRDVDWETIFEDSPYNMSTMQQYVGSFLGTAGDWAGAFETAGCCDVVIPCHSDCVYLRGCGDDVEIGRVANSEPSKQNYTFTDVEIDAQPNPVLEKIEISLTGDWGELLEFSIQDINGSLVLERIVKRNNDASFLFDISNLNNGLYVLLVKDDQGNISNTRVVKN